MRPALHEQHGCRERSGRRRIWRPPGQASCRGVDPGTSRVGPRGPLPPRSAIYRSKRRAPCAVAPSLRAGGRAQGAGSTCERRCRLQAARRSCCYVFMPPLYEAVRGLWLALVAHGRGRRRARGNRKIIGSKVTGLRRTIRACGVLKVTPDPGVIEVNVATVPKLVARGRSRTPTGLVCRGGARGAASTADKFMVDGRHVGTGGGNHVVVGGAEPAEESPFLRRPDLIKSRCSLYLAATIRALSYLF